MGRAGSGAGAGAGVRSRSRSRGRRRRRSRGRCRGRGRGRGNERDIGRVTERCRLNTKCYRPTIIKSGGRRRLDFGS